MTGVVRLAVWLGGVALITATLVNTLGVIGRRIGVPLHGAIDIVQVCVLIAGGLALMLATGWGAHARIRLILDRLAPGPRAIGLRVCDLLAAVAFAALGVGSAWLVADLWNAHESSEILKVSWQPLRLYATAVLAVVALLFAFGRVGAAAMIYANPATGLLGLSVLFVLLVGGVPIGAALALVGLVGLAVILGPGAALIKGGVIVVDTLTRYELGTLPLFMLMAQLFFAANASRDLFDAAAKLVGHRRGGLAYASIGGCAGFGAVNGSSLATAATIGLVALPEMRSRGYSDALATGTVAAGGTLGQMLPPSGALIVFAIIAEQSIGKLFTATLIPGISQMLFYCAVIWILTRLRPGIAPPTERADWPTRWRALARIWDMIALIFVVLGGIAFGWFSPAEASSIGTAGALAIAAIRRRLTLPVLERAFAETLRTSGLIFLVIIGALIFSVFVSVTGLADAVGQIVTGLGFGTTGTVIVMAVLLLLLGSVLDGLALMLLTTPILLPIVVHLGLSPIWFGIFIVRAMEIGFVHPPLGMNLYVIQGVAPDVPIGRVFKGVLPFLASDMVHLLLLILFPAIALWLPGVLGQ